MPNSMNCWPMKVNHVVLDTNVLISALLSQQGAARKTLDIVRNHGTLIFSEETFTELLSRLYRPKFDPYVTDNQRSEYLANLIDMSEWVVIQNDAMGCRDSDDDKFLETALIGDADALINGDSDLLVLQQIGSIPILSVADFLSNFP